MGKKLVFISYPKSQAERAAILINRLGDKFRKGSSADQNGKRSCIGGSDYFLPLLSKDGKDDANFMEEIDIALRAYRENASPQIISLSIGDESGPTNFGLFEFLNRPFLGDSEDFDYVIKLIDSGVIAKLKRSHIAMSIVVNMAIKLIGLALTSLPWFQSEEKEEALRYNFYSFPIAQPFSPDKPFEFLDPYSENDPMEGPIKNLALQEDEDGEPFYSHYLAFFLNDRGEFIGTTQEPEELRGDDVEIIDEIPAGTQVLMVVLGKPAVLENVRKDLQTGKPLPESKDKFIWLFYG